MSANPKIWMVTILDLCNFAKRVDRRAFDNETAAHNWSIQRVEELNALHTPDDIFSYEATTVEMELWS